jgi:hypothetical protein
VYESQVVRDPSTLIALLKPLLHHEPLQMMSRHKDMLVAGSLADSAKVSQLDNQLRHLKQTNEFSLELLDHLQAWHGLSRDQRSSMLGFFERSLFLCRFSNRSDSRLVASRVRCIDLTHDAESVTEKSSYHALYLLPMYHIGIIARLQAIVSSVNMSHIQSATLSGRDSLIIHRGSNVTSCACAFVVEGFRPGVQQNARFQSLCGLVADRFSCVLRISGSDFGLFKFAAACADDLMDSGTFGTRFQCWVAATHDVPSRCRVQEWKLFRNKVTAVAPSAS